MTEPAPTKTRVTDALAEAVTAITSDQGSSGHFAPLGNLPAIRAHVLGAG
jgi:hypothetical protein